MSHLAMLDGLNERQRAAVVVTAGPVLVLAGAGSGKTRVLTERVVYLIGAAGVSPSAILAVTFTNRAAREMQTRVARQTAAARRDKPSSGLFLPWLGTFHATGVKILRRDGQHIGIDTGFTIYDAEDQLALIRTLCRDLAIDVKRHSPHAIRSYISSAKSELLDAHDYERFASGYFQTIVLEVFRRYEAALTRARAIDFDDCLTLPVKLFYERPDILERYQDALRHIMIDEYQDTNKAQYELVRLLAGKYRNVFVVGDDAQSIYGWRGANFRNILDFEKDYPEAKVIKLEQNYRSTQVILAASNAVIDHNTQRIPKALWTEKSRGAPVSLYLAQDGRDEAEFIMTELISLQRQGHSLGDCAVLYRTNAQSRVLEEACLEANVAYRLVGAMRFYDRKEVKDMLAYLRFLVNPSDEMSLGRLLSAPPRGLGDKSLAEIKRSLRSEVNKTALPPRIQKIWAPLAEKFATWRDKAARLTVAELIDMLAKESGYEAYLLDGTPEGEARYENIRELKSVASLTDDLGAFLAEVALMADVDGYDQEGDALTLMTLHSAKGLEFPVVFIVGMEEGLFPNMRHAMDASELEEERRLCYVGMTRAKDKLYCLHAANRLLYGGLHTNLPSRFLGEIPDDLVEKI